MNSAAPASFPALIASAIDASSRRFPSGVNRAKYPHICLLPSAYVYTCATTACFPFRSNGGTRNALSANHVCPSSSL